MDLSKMMKQAQEMQKKLVEAQRRIEELQVEGISGGGMVSIVIDGKGALKSVTINKALLDEKEPDIIEDLIIAAHNEARTKLEEKKSEEMGDLVGVPMGLF